MSRLTATIVFFLLLIFPVLGQGLDQTVRGTIVDQETRVPLPGATVVIFGTDPFIGTATDALGRFRLENVPVGRVSLQISFLGYESQTVPGIVVNSGKEVVLDVELQESIASLNEVVVTASTNRGQALNEMSIISGRSVSAEETQRFAGGFTDPSRIVTNFAGVATANDGDNEVIVRGNSPKYVQWRLEGMEITNPNHFADQNSAKGGISALNNNLLATSDFYTGAFSAEYGDVLSGVYDLKLRPGNNERFEAVVGVGFLGTDLTVEGPFKKGYGGSFLANYRYSTVTAVNELGLIDVDGLLNFQDGAFKVVLPTGKVGVLSMFGLGGFSSFALSDVKPDLFVTPGDTEFTENVREDYDKRTFMYNGGLNYSLSVGSNGFLNASLGYSQNGINDDVFELRTRPILDTAGEFLRDSVLARNLDYNGLLRKTSYRASLTYRHKLNTQNTVEVGSKYGLLDYGYNQSWLNDDKTGRTTLVDFDEGIGSIRNFVSWRLRASDKLTMVAGVHNVNVLFNKQSTFEPRVALNWRVAGGSLNAGYGNHSTMESIHHYFAEVARPDGTVDRPNQDLGLLKAHHFVLGYEKRFTADLMAKLDVYYQDLYDLPVANDTESIFATVNEGVDFQYVDLVNEGTGKNYGVEFTLEKFLSNKTYFLINGSLFKSTYVPLDGMERNTQYDGNYLFNILFGKEFDKLGRKKNQTLALNAKMFFGGGKKQLRLLRDAAGNLDVDPDAGRFYDYENAYENSIEDVYHIILSASYKWNRPGSTHELFLDLDNVTNTKGRLVEYFDADEPGNVGYMTQFGFFPNLQYKVYF